MSHRAALALRITLPTGPIDECWWDYVMIQTRVLDLPPGFTDLVISIDTTNPVPITDKAVGFCWL